MGIVHYRGDGVGRGKGLVSQGVGECRILGVSAPLDRRRPKPEDMNLEERFSDHLRALGSSIWEAQHNHPFVTGVGDGTLEVERLKFWVRQDYLYLIDYARVYNLAAAKAPDPELSGWLTFHADFTLNKEMALHRSYAQDFGIGEEELVAERKAPTCQAYTDFLMRTAAVEPFEAIIAALLPCFWGYYEMGKSLEERGAPDNELYVRWIEQYTDPGYGKEVQKCRELIDRLGKAASASTLALMEESFITSSRYEYLFWEMCYSMERWPV